MNDLVSIITPSYNVEAFIARTINSVLLQTYSNWELLIVDDCSKDTSATIINEYVKKEVPITVRCISGEEESRGVYPNIEHMINNGVQIEYE